MTLDQAKDNIGSGVVYRAHPGARPEDGTISSVGSRFVFVLFRGDTCTKATVPEHLEIADEPPTAQIVDLFAALERSMGKS